MFAMAAIVAVVYRQPARAQGAGSAAPAAGGNGGGGTAVWVFKPKDISFVPPNKPVWHIADILAAHKGQTDWAQTVMKDQWFVIQYISLGPGKKTPVSYASDTVRWFIIKSGQAKFTIKGQEPFIASKDFMVQVPMRTAYSIETVGNEPSVRFEVRVADDGPVFPVADNPTPPDAPPGYTTVKVSSGIKATTPDPTRKTYLDFDKDMVNNPNPAPRGAGGDNFFVRDARGFEVPIRGAAVPPPPDTNIGHFHLGLAEWWYVLEGEVDVKIEGVPDVVKGYYGDLIYSPQGAYHRTALVGKPFSTRVASGAVTDSGSSFTQITAP
jgi:mannose-6-phosphate isomerase-like protein (cupin superfamily)